MYRSEATAAACCSSTASHCHPIRVSRPATVTVSVTRVQFRLPEHEEQILDAIGRLLLPQGRTSISSNRNQKPKVPAPKVCCSRSQARVVHNKSAKICYENAPNGNKIGGVVSDTITFEGDINKLKCSRDIIGGIRETSIKDFTNA